MGIFSSETKHLITAYVSSTPLIDPSDYTNTRLEFILSALRNDNEDVAEGIMASNLTGFHVNVQRFINYGQNHYTFPPPYGNFNYVAEHPDLLRTLQEYIYPDNPDVYIETSQIGPLNQYFFSLNWLSHNADLVDGSKWDANTPVIEIRDLWGRAAKAHNNPYTKLIERGSNLYIRISLPRYQSSAEDPQVAYVHIPFDRIAGVGLVPSGTYYHVRVGFQEEPDRLDYWLYRADDGTYPWLGTVQQVNSNFLPVAILMRDKVYFDDLGDDDLTETTVKLLKKLNMDAFDIIEQVKEQDTQENVEKYDFFIGFTLEVPLEKLPPANNPGDTDLAVSEYAFNFARAEYDPNGVGWEQWMDWALYVGSSAAAQAEWDENNSDGDRPPDDTDSIAQISTPAYTINVKTGGSNSYEAIHSWNFIKKSSRLSSGDIEPYFSYGFNEYLSKIPSKWKHLYPPIPPGYIVSSKVSDAVWESYYVAGLELYYAVNTDDGIKYVQDGPYLPLHESLLDSLNAPQRERVLQEAARAVMFLVHDEAYKVKWYQKGLAKVLFIAITVLVVIFTAQVELVGWLATITAATGAVLTLQTILLKLAIGFLVSFTANNVIGGDLGLIFALAAGIYMSGGFAGIGNKIDTAIRSISDLSFNSAMPYLKTVTDIYVHFGYAELADDYRNLQYEAEDYLKSAEERKEELDDAFYELNPPSNINPISLVTRGNSEVYAESPGRFFDRTLRQNPGVESLDLIKKFCTLCLTLPEEPTDGNPAETLNHFGSGA